MHCVLQILLSTSILLARRCCDDTAAGEQRCRPRYHKFDNMGQIFRSGLAVPVEVVHRVLDTVTQAVDHFGTVLKTHLPLRTDVQDVNCTHAPRGAAPAHTAFSFPGCLVPVGARPRYGPRSTLKYIRPTLRAETPPPCWQTCALCRVCAPTLRRWRLSCCGVLCVQLCVGVESE